MPTSAPLRVGVLCSERAPGLAQLLNTDHRRGTEYEIVCCLTSGDEFAEEVRVERRGVPCLHHPIRTWCRHRDVMLTDLQARREYDRSTVKLLEPFHPDLLVLDGYLLLLTQPMLDAYDGRIVNVHHADLLLRDASGAPAYPGLRAVRDAILAGETETRATAHVVTERLDDGPILLRSWPFALGEAGLWARQHEATDMLRACIWTHQQWMLRCAWPVMLSRVIELATHALQAAGRPLDLSAAGRWLLSENGALTPDEVRIAAGVHHELAAG